jgi:sugar/nucleoside kinase (ribokinase family)
MAFDYEFVGVGGLAVDLVLRVDRLPLADDKYLAEIVDKLPGGFIANATCAAAQLGLRAGYVGCVGEDADGDMLRGDFEQRKVDLSGLIRARGAITPFTLVITDRQGQRAILLPSFPLYQAELTYDQVQCAGRAQVVYTFPRDLVWCRQLRQASMESGGLLALDVESATPMRGDELRDAIRMADIVFFTENSLKTLNYPPIQKLVGPRQWMIMTAGARGAYGVEHGRRKPTHQPALPVEAVDTTGAGDCFHAALIAARLDGASLPDSLAFANAAAAIKAQHQGARGGLPTREQVEALLRSRR